MKEFKTEKRLNKISNVVKARQTSLTVVLENIHDPHNVSAIYRTCDAVGILNVNLLYNREEFPRISSVTSASASKWLTTTKYVDTAECFSKLRADGFKIYSSFIVKDAVSIYDIDFTEKVAVVMGNEHRGISGEAFELADEKFYIPMTGMIQSLNVSVATAVTLYEALRQRKAAGMYEKSEMPHEEIDNLINKWCEK